jgi:hypothetical protein
MGYCNVEFVRADEAEAAARALDAHDVPALGPSLVVTLVNPAKSPDRAACTLRAPRERRRREAYDDRPGARPGAARGRGAGG